MRVQRFEGAVILVVMLGSHWPGMSTARGDESPADGSLPRRAWFGAQLEPAEGGVRVRAVLPDTSAEAAGFQPGDVITALNGEPVTQIPALIRTLRALPGGREVEMTRTRDGMAEPVRFTLTEWPREPETDRYRVEYGTVPNPVGLLRTITLVPKGPAPAGGKYPGLLVIQGLGAVTLDNSMPGAPIDQPIGMGVYRTIAAGLADAGFVTMRVDKGGCGDSQGDAALFDFQQELEAYRQALKALKARPDVDPERVFLFGHSMGGVFGPMLAAEEPVRGLAVYGTLVKTWLEYLAENSRRQAMLAGTDPAAFDQQARRLERFHHALHVEKKSPQQIFEASPELREPLADDLMLDGDSFFGRHFTFFQQLNDVNLPEHWRKLDCDVLSMWGVAEFVTGRDDHEQIAAIVNARHPGKGTFFAVPDTDHGFERAATPKEALDALNSGPGGPSKFNPLFLETMKAWMVDRAKS